MNNPINFNFFTRCDCAKQLQHIQTNLEQLMTTTTELAAALQANNALLVEGKTEITAELQRLSDLIATSPLTPESEQALADLGVLAQSIADIIPGSPAPTVP